MYLRRKNHIRHLFSDLRWTNWWKMKFQGIERKRFWFNRGTDPCLYLKAWIKPQNLNDDNLCPSPYLSRAPPKYKPAALSCSNWSVGTWFIHIKVYFLNSETNVWVPLLYYVFFYLFMNEACPVTGGWHYMLLLVGNAGPAPIQVPSLHSLHIVTFGYTICCLFPCCQYSISKSIEFVNFVNCFRCLEINSCLFFGQLPCFDISLFSVSLGFCIMCVCVI